MNSPKERVYWEVLKEFNTLPTSEDARKMCEGDYVYCYIHMLLDSENKYSEEGINTNFSEDEFMKRSDDFNEDI